MTNDYCKLVSGIILSTIWREDDATRILWITLLALKDRQHCVYASIPGLAVVANLSVEDVRKSLEKLMAPDPDSRTKDNEGRRIKAIDGGWFVINGEKYRNYMSKAERNAYQAALMAERREEAKRKKLAGVSSVRKKLAVLAQAEAEVPLCPVPSPAPAQGILRYAQDATGNRGVTPGSSPGPAPGAADAALSHSADAPVKGKGDASRKKLPKKEKPPSKRWHPDSEVFLDLWSVAFRDFFGFDYSNSPRDRGCTNELLHQNPTLKPMEIVEIAKLAWKSDRFVCQRARVISQFVSQFNAIRCELKLYGKRTTAKPNPRNAGVVTLESERNGGPTLGEKIRAKADRDAEKRRLGAQMAAPESGPSAGRGTD